VRLADVGALTPVEALPLGALPGLEPLDRLVGGAVVAALLQVRVAGSGPRARRGSVIPYRSRYCLTRATVCRHARCLWVPESLS
jgi:hypothetical protein